MLAPLIGLDRRLEPLAEVDPGLDREVEEGFRGLGVQLPFAREGKAPSSSEGPPKFRSLRHAIEFAGANPLDACVADQRGQDPDKWKKVNDPAEGTSHPNSMLSGRPPDDPRADS